MLTDIHTLLTYYRENKKIFRKEALIFDIEASFLFIGGLIKMSQLRFRRKEKKYTEVYNTIIFKNKNVELTGLYTTIQACIDLEINTKGTDNEFTLSKKTLQHYCGYKDDKFKRIWNELKVAGYLKQYKIKNKDGKFIYEYELLDEPDLTLHHSLIQNEDGSIVPNIPKSKIEKLKKDMDKKPEGEKPPLEPEGEKPHSGKMGVYYNTSLNKVCMYVCKAKENFALSEKNKQEINSIKEKIPFDLFEEIIVDSKNKNKTFSYVIGTINNCIRGDILTLDKYIETKKNYKNTKTKKTESQRKQPKKPLTRFHNITDRTANYTPEELEALLQENQKKKFRSLDTEKDMANIDIPVAKVEDKSEEVEDHIEGKFKFKPNFNHSFEN